MKKKVLKPDFFENDTLEVAEALLGKFLVRKLRGRETAMMITEVEAYDGLKDRGSHASRGKTARNAPMFGRPGRWYVYFTYGMHWMLNIVTKPENYPAAVLIRGLEGVSGPARITKKLKIDGKFNNKPAGAKTGLWIEDRGIKIPAKKIGRGKRIGINYAGKIWAGKLWRFFIAESRP